MQTPLKAPQRGKRWRRLAFALVIATALGGSAAVYVNLSGPDLTQRNAAEAANTQPRGQLPPPVGGQLSGRALPDFTALVARTTPAVVSISAEPTEAARKAMQDGSATGSSPETDPPAAPGPEMEARGSGFIIDADGTIITNNHVVADSQSILVTLRNGNKLAATVLGRDERNDIALLKIDAGHPLPFVQLRDSRAVRPGEWVIAIGNPFGLGETVTSGIVSGVQRRIGKDTVAPLIQVDAPINRGNSGGPLFALDGKVVGMDTAILSPSGESAGVGFALAPDLIRRVVARLEADTRHTPGSQPQPPAAAAHAGSARRGDLGMALAPLKPGLGDLFGIGPHASGAVVVDVRPGSMAEIAGLQPGDVIVAVDTHAVRSPAQTEQAVLSSLDTGKHAVAVRIIRKGRAMFVGIDGGQSGSRR